jgi:hypothetical protein
MIILFPTGLFSLPPVMLPDGTRVGCGFVVFPALLTPIPTHNTQNDPNSLDNIDWSYLSATYGSLDVTVTDCLGNDLSPSQMKFGDVIEKWASDDAQLLYVKDWHLPRWAASQPHLSPFYSTPPVFADDWLNCYYSTFTDDDFRFVYLGVQGTFTPFHKDVYDSYSWSVNVVGKKLWTFWSPDDAHQTHPGIEVIQEAGETMFV